MSMAKQAVEQTGLEPDRVYLIDALVYIFRAYHALPSSMTGPDGQPFNAVHGFVSFLAKVLTERRPARIAVAFDASLTSCFRNRIDPQYKANRPPADPEFKAQIALCQATCEASGLLTLASEEFEADDFIATLAAQARQQGLPITIVSRDKDLLQLLGPDDVLWDGADRLRRADAVLQDYGVPPEQFTNFQGLVGDAVDNIPGVPGIGPKAAAAILQAYPTLDDALADLDGVAALPVRGAKRLAGLLETHQEAALRSRELATLRTDVPLDAPWPALTPTPPADLATTLESIGLTSRLAQRLSSAMSAL